MPFLKLLFMPITFDSGDIIIDIDKLTTSTVILKKIIYRIKYFDNLQLRKKKLIH